MREWQFTSPDLAERKLIEVTRAAQIRLVSHLVRQKFVNYGERLIPISTGAKPVNVHFYYDLTLKLLILESQDQNVQGSKVAIKQEDVPKWIANHSVRQAGLVGSLSDALR